LLYHGEGQAGDKFLLGLLDVKELKKKLRQHFSALKSNLSEHKVDPSDSKVFILSLVIIRNRKVLSFTFRDLKAPGKI
jgi:hypothetical protein